MSWSLICIISIVFLSLLNRAALVEGSGTLEAQLEAIRVSEDMCFCEALRAT